MEAGEGQKDSISFLGKKKSWLVNQDLNIHFEPKCQQHAVDYV